MKMRFLLVMALLLLLISFSTLRAEDKAPYLEKAYFGALYVGSMPDYYQFQNDIFPLVGVKTKFPILSGNLYSRLLYNFQKPNAHFWWMKKISFFEFNAGYFPRPVAIINRPEPVSNAGNFEPPCKGVIPGPALGVLGRINSKKIGSDLMFGLYKTNKDSVEFNLGIQQEINWSIFKKVGISGYHSNQRNKDGDHVNGIVLNAELKRLSLMFFSGRDVNSIRTYSGFAYFALTDKAGIYTQFVHQQEKWQIAEIGIFKILSEKICGIETEYLLGMGYVYSEIRASSINFYLQVWLDKDK